MKLRFKITFIVIVLAIVIIMIMALFYANYLFEDKIKQVKDKLSYDSRDLASHIESNLLDGLDIVKTMQSAYVIEQTLSLDNAKYNNMSKQKIDKKLLEFNKKWMMSDANNSFIRQYTDNRLARYLKKQKNTLPGVYGEIFITDKYGGLVASTGKLTTFKHNQKYWWKESYNHGYGKVFFDDRGFDDSVEGYVLGIVVPIKKSKKIIGIIKANINVQSLLDKTVETYNKLHVGTVKLVRSKGLVVYEANLPPLSTRISHKLLEKLMTLKSGITQMKIFEETMVVAYSPVKLSMDRKDIVFGGKKRSIDHLLGNDGEIWHIVIQKDRDEILDKVWFDIKNLINIGLGFIVLLAFVLFIVIDKMSLPLRRLSDIAKRVGRGERDIEIEPESDDEVGELAVSFGDMLEDLKRTTASRNELEAEIKKRIEIQKELKRQGEILIAQSKQAAMGEMIGMIAHQWRQPISIVAMAVNNILVDLELDELTEESVRECANEILSETQYLSQTIDDFRNFFKPNKAKETIAVQQLYDNTYKIMGKSLENNNIELNFSGDLMIDIKTYAKELVQVFINILNNAKDALVDYDLSRKKIFISVNKQKNSVIFKFCDNAGGVKEEIMDRIFEPYFSTKEEKNGTGLGLYMCKNIVEKHLKGKIWVKNEENGTCFMIKLPTDLKENSE